MRIVVLLPQAVEDLDLIQDPLFTKVIQKLKLLEDFPSLGPPMDGPFSGYRMMTVGLFRVVCKIVSEHRIEVAYIRHCKRRPL